MKSDMPTIRHAMPTDPPNSGKTSWFYDQNAFERQELTHLVDYKRNVLNIHDDGRYPKKPENTYPHILPDGCESAVFYEGIADAVFAYLKQENIQIHTEILNLKSSQAACLNFLFPLRLDPALAVHVLRKQLHGLDAITNIEFEYTGQDESPGAREECTEWLGEPPGGKRGQNRTSIDAAIFWTDKSAKKHITLVEWKYTERSFGSCSAFAKAKGNDKTGCLSSSFRYSCLLVNHGPRRNRHYWKHLDVAGIRLEKMSSITGCPFRGPFYQLMRQYLIAQFLRNKYPEIAVDVMAIHFSKNKALNDVPAELMPLCQTDKPNVISAWNSTLDSVPALQSIDVEYIMSEYDLAKETDPDWRAFIRQRYRV